VFVETLNTYRPLASAPASYVREFDAVFTRADVRVMPTAPWAQNQNAFVERWTGELRYECLNRFITFELSHLDYIVAEYVLFYDEAWGRVSEKTTAHLRVFG
jgi:hypothetical protein